MTLLIVGASARAAAHSAVRAGWSPVAFDLFGDRDLASACASTRPIARDSYPHALESMFREAPDAPWIYTGALENHPDLIDRLAALRPLWGISGAALRAVRDPIAVARALNRRGLPTADVRTSHEGLPRDGSWLVKPIASAGGRRIAPLEDRDIARPVYYQERIDGPSLAAIFVGGGAGSALLGVTRQLVGREGEPFAYVGSLGPWPIEPGVRGGIAAIGDALVDAFGLRGLFGVDLVLDARGRAIPVEVNPRYTASVEVLELASGRAMLSDHGEAFGSGESPRISSRHHPPAFVAKRILFADHRAIWREMHAPRLRSDAAPSFVVPFVADLPADGTIFEPGDPVLTVLARGGSALSCEARLERRLARWRGVLRRMT